VAELKAMGYTHIFIATGAWKHNTMDIPRANMVSAFDWLRDYRAKKDVPLGHVVVVGGGNVAVDVARAAVVSGATSSTLVYRRTRKYMSANHLEIEKALADGVKLMELTLPTEKAGSKLLCSKLMLGMPDATGRREPIDMGGFELIPCDTIITALGESVFENEFTANGIEVNEHGYPAFRTNVEGVYAGGAAIRRAADVVDGIADAKAFAEIVIGEAHTYTIPEGATAEPAAAIAKKGILCDFARTEGDRCLNCAVVCQVCGDVCPSRANATVLLPDGRRQILHVDHLCSDCGNCAIFCPYASSPAKDKFTLFSDRAAFDASSNQGFLPLGGSRVLVRLDGQVTEADLDGANSLSADIEVFILTVLKDYGYLL
jgi:putative selenate reductase